MLYPGCFVLTFLLCDISSVHLYFVLSPSVSLCLIVHISLYLHHSLLHNTWTCTSVLDPYSDWLRVEKIKINVWNSLKYGITLYYIKKNTVLPIPYWAYPELLPAARTVCVMTTGIRTCPPIIPVLLIFYRVKDRDRKQNMMTKTTQMLFSDNFHRKKAPKQYIYMNWWWKSADVGRKQWGGRKGKTKDKHKRRERAH